jgi:hypothetical protein
MYFLIGLLVGFILTLIIYGILVWSFMQLQEPSRDLLKKIGELFIFGIICILVVTITIIIIKPYA